MLKKNNISFSVPWSGEGLFFSFMAAQYSNQVAVGHRKIYNYRLNNTGSGLTNYNVQMGINALWNIKNIGKNVANPSRKIDNAVRWHIWKNYNYLLFLIVATNTQHDKYKNEYLDCIKNIRKMLFKVMSTSEVGINTKIRMLMQGMFPILWARKRLKKEVVALKNDKME